ncbi:MAG: tRNA ((37)-N6)-methyltransferase TrmO [Pseudomonadota bacterium]
MSGHEDIRAGEERIALPGEYDAGLYFIGRIRTPFKSRSECPKNTRQSEAIGTVEIDPRYAAGLAGIEKFSHVILLYWMHEARRDLISQVPRHLGEKRGTFALRSPVRPNPVSLGVVELLGVEGSTLKVRKVDCLDGTPLIDIKPYYASTDCHPDAKSD